MVVPVPTVVDEPGVEVPGVEVPGLGVGVVAGVVVVVVGFSLAMRSNRRWRS